MTSTPIAFPPAPVLKTTAFDSNYKALVSAWKKAKRKMILVGVSKPNPKLASLLEILLQDPSVVVLTEKTSNFSHPNAIAAIDCLMAPLELEQNGGEKELQPNVLLTIGGMIISKKIKSFLRKHQALAHFHVDQTKANDTFYYLSEHINAPTEKTLKVLAEAGPTNSDYQDTVLLRYRNYLRKGNTYLSKIPFSDLHVFDLITQSLPQNTHVQVANSSPIRYMQLFDLPKGTEVFCNRGTAGIDGSTATAMGAAQINPKQMVLVTGDLSFFYDINGLWHNYIPNHVRIIVINNQGGGIFRILPGEKDSPKYDTYFETIHARNARNMAKAFGFGYRSVQTNWGLKRALRRFFNPSNQPKILEICTPRKINDTVLLDYFKAMANAKNK